MAPQPAPLSSLPLSSRLGEVASALAATDPPPQRVVLFGSRARGDERPDSDLDLLAIFPQPSLTPVERQQALTRLRQALEPLDLRCGVDLLVIGHADAERLSGSRWHVVARALREGKELHVSG
jgi:uncharacterized protein